MKNSNKIEKKDRDDVGGYCFQGQEQMSKLEMRPNETSVNFQTKHPVRVIPHSDGLCLALYKFFASHACKVTWGSASITPNARSIPYATRQPLFTPSFESSSFSSLNPLDLASEHPTFCSDGTPEDSENTINSDPDPGCLDSDPSNQDTNSSATQPEDSLMWLGL